LKHGGPRYDKTAYEGTVRILLQFARRGPFAEMGFRCNALTLGIAPAAALPSAPSPGSINTANAATVQLSKQQIASETKINLQFNSLCHDCNTTLSPRAYKCVLGYPSSVENLYHEQSHQHTQA